MHRSGPQSSNRTKSQFRFDERIKRKFQMQFPGFIVLIWSILDNRSQTASETRPNDELFSWYSSVLNSHFRLTIKAKCPMMLRSFPMDWQSCPLVIGSCKFLPSQFLFRRTNQPKTLRGIRPHGLQLGWPEIPGSNKVRGEWAPRC